MTDIRDSAWAVIFDMDGVIVDSARFHEESWHVLAKETGWTLPPGFFHETFGMRNMNIIPKYLDPLASIEQVAAWSARKEVLYRELCRGRIDLLPGVRSLVEGLAKKGGRLAIGSSTERANIKMILETTGLESFFQAIVSSEDVSVGKPEPDVFLLAARRLDVPPDRCVVIEDAMVGIEAALRAGMKCLACATTHPVAQLQRAGRIVKNLDEVTADDLYDWTCAVPTLG